VNAEKRQRTALQFVKEMNLPENLTMRDRLGVWTENRFREFVNSLWPTRDPFKRSRAGGPRPTDDEARCWRRKEFLLTEKWEEKDFTPADLANTRVVTKFAAQRLEKEYADLPNDQRPQVIIVPGAVTAAFRDKVWKLLNELQAVHPEVKRTLEEGEKVKAQGKDFNPKKAIRDVTHLHHAVDAIGLALVTAKIVPFGGRAGLDGDFARWIVKGKLTAEERRQFEGKRHQLRLPKFYSWQSNGEGGALCIDELTPEEKEQIRKRLAEKRVVQHIPARMSGLRVEQNTWRVVGNKGGEVLLRQQIRQADGSRPVKETTEKEAKLMGLEKGKLQGLKGALVIPDNFGVALDPTPTVIPFHKVWPRLQLLQKANGGKRPRVLRNGQLIRVPNGSRAGIWRVMSTKSTEAYGLALDLALPDKVKLDRGNAPVERLVQDGMEIVKCGLTGVDSSGVTIAEPRKRPRKPKV
jgi:hypothetical protein